MNERELIVGLDIGTVKVVAIAAELDENGHMVVLGMGTHYFENNQSGKKQRGLKKGVIISIEATVEAISRAIQEAELMAGRKIKYVYTGIAGAHVKSKDSDGVTVVNGKEITSLDVERAIETANTTPISADDKIIHTLVQEFVVDGQGEVKEPVGMEARRLEVKVHLVTGAVMSVQNIVKCVRRCGLEVDDLVLQPLASGFAVLSEDEKDVGVCLVDIGGGTTDVAIFVKGAIRHTAIIPIAGEQLTADIGIALRTSTQDAEEIKQNYGVALQQLADAREMIQVPGIGDRPPSQLSRQTLAGFIQPRVEEIFTLVQEEILRSSYGGFLRAGIVLTGGSALMPGLVELGEEFFHKTVKVGMPLYNGNLKDVVKNPRYSTAMGLLIEGSMQYRYGNKLKGPLTYRQVFKRIGNWLNQNFF